MKRASTIFLRLAIVFIALVVLAFCVFALPEAWIGGPAEFPMAAIFVKLIVSGLYLTAIPFYLALWQALKLLNYIDQDKAFSHLSVIALENITLYAAIITIIYIIFVPLIFPIAQADDAPGLILVTAAIAGAPMAATVFVAILKKLLKQAIAIKSENELTV